MVFDTTDRTVRNGGPLLAFCTVCVVGAVLVGLLAAEPVATPPSNAGAPTNNVGKDLPPPVLPTPESVAQPKYPAPTSVLLPPIQPPRNSSQIPLPSHTLPFAPATTRQIAPPSLMEPPPAVSLVAKMPKDILLEVVVGQKRVLTFPDVPLRVVLAADVNDPIALLREVPHKPCEWYLLGKKPGSTFLDVWLPDPTNKTSPRVLHYAVRIRAESDRIAEKRIEKPVVVPLPPPPSPPRTLPEQRQVERPRTLPEQRQVERPRAESMYSTLEEEINRAFPGCSVQLKQVGESLVVSGKVRNIFEATRILTIARENAPGARSNEPSRTPGTPSLQATLDNYAQAGGRHVVNLLRIPGEEQIVLRVVVAEVNRAAARSLGLDFGLADKRATVLTSRPAAGSSTVAQNGWIGSVLRTLQDLHYAQSLAEPTLTTLNGQTARFKAGGEFPIPVVHPGPQGALQGVSFRSYGVNLAIQPVVADTDRIRLTVEAEVSGTDPQTAAQVGGSAVPGLKVRNFASTVELREGETLAVAGLIRGSSRNTMPGTVSASIADNAPSDQELIVLISPLLMHSQTSAEKSEKSVKSLTPQEIERYLHAGKESVPSGDIPYLIGPQGYAGTTGHSSAPQR